MPYIELHKNQNINGCPKSHLHDKLTIVALEKGNLKINLKNNQIVLKENQIAIINPFEIHSAIKINENSSNLYSPLAPKLHLGVYTYEIINHTAKQ